MTGAEAAATENGLSLIPAGKDAETLRAILHGIGWRDLLRSGLHSALIAAYITSRSSCPIAGSPRNGRSRSSVFFTPSGAA